MMAAQADEGQGPWNLWRAFGCSPCGGCGKQPSSTKQDISDADPSNVYLADDSDMLDPAGGSFRRLLSERPLSLRKDEEKAAGTNAGGSASSSAPRSDFAGVFAAQLRAEAKEKAAVDGAKKLRRATTLEVQRGVHIEKVYDLYNTATRKTETRNMPRDVIHDRAAMVGDVPLCEEALEKMQEMVEVGSPTASQKSGGSSCSSGIWSEKSPSSKDKAVEGALSAKPADAGGGSFFSDSSVTSSDSSSSDVSSHISSGPSSREITPLTPSPALAMRMRKRSKEKDAVPNQEAVTSWAVFTGKLIHSRSLNFSALAEMALQNTRQVAAAKKSRIAGSVERRAKFAVEQARMLAKKIAAESVDVLDSEWEAAALECIFGEDYFDGLMLIAQSARKLLSSQPMLAECQAPCRIFGDIHGQLRDLLLLLHVFGMPRGPGKGTHLIFNGDFVDRGCHQVECIGLLLAMKLAMPDRVWLVRGNHEDRAMNERYGFKDACTETLGEENGSKIFEKMQSAFQELPIACLIQKNILVVHGGIGEGKWRVGDIKTVPRPLTESYLANPENAWVYNILWSDPIEDDNPTAAGVFGVHQSPRGQNQNQFGWDVTKTFCAVNGLNLIVRSHQSKFGSLGFDLMHENLLVRVFSARDYEDQCNDGAVLLISPAKQALAGPKEPKAARLLQVRPQVIRSVMKTREEEEERIKGPASRTRRTSMGSASSDLPGPSSSPSAQSMRPAPKAPDKKEQGGLPGAADPGAPSKAAVVAMAVRERRKSLGIDMFFGSSNG